MLGTAITHETVDLQVLFEGEVERKRGEEDDRLDVVEEWYPVLALLLPNLHLLPIEMLRVRGKKIVVFDFDFRIRICIWGFVVPEFPT